MSLQFKLIGIFIVTAFLFIAGVLAGYKYEHNKFVIFKNKIINASREAEIKNQAIEQHHKDIVNGVKNEYEARLFSVNAYYSRVLNNTNSGILSQADRNSKGIDGIPSYNVLVGQCAKTTLMLVSLQEILEKADK
jgi:hypothetical protein